VAALLVSPIIRVTDAEGMTAPEESVITPRSDPVCQAVTAIARRKNASTAMNKLRKFM
jgi:hypothetical protein